MRYKALAVLKAWAATAGVLAALTVTHDIGYREEDSRVVWICGWDGDGGCGPDSSAVDVRPFNLLRW